MPRFHSGYGWIKIAKYAVLGLVLMFLGNIVGKAVADDRVQEPLAVHVFADVFANSVLMFGEDEDGMKFIDMHDAKLVLVRYDECLQLIIDTPLSGPQFVMCAPDVMDHDAE